MIRWLLARIPLEHYKILNLGLAGATVLLMVLGGPSREVGDGHTWETMSSAPVTYDTIIYVSPFGSDSNDGSSWQSAKATLAGALAVLPNCTATGVKGNSWTLPCGQIEVYTGNMVISSPITITSPFISIIGLGPGATQFTWSGAGCAITVDEETDNDFPGPTLRGFSIDGTGNTNAGACGLHYENSSHLILRNMTISGFTASQDSCLYGSTGKTSDERQVFEHLVIGNCAVGWLIRNLHQSFWTFGYGSFDLYMNVGANQVGIESFGNGPSAELRFLFSVFHIIINEDGAGSTCAKISNYSHWAGNVGVFRCDGIQHGVYVDNTSYFYFGGDINIGGGWHVDNGGHLVVQEISQDPNGGNDTLQEWEKATASNPGTGPIWRLYGQYWNGSASVVDGWKLHQIPSTNSSNLVWEHDAGPSAAYFGVPTLRIIAAPGRYGSYNNTLSAPGGGYYKNTLPAANGTLALKGADGTSAGTIALYGGFGSHTFKTAYQAIPVCTATDISGLNPVKLTVSNAAISVTGNGSDVINWICAPAAN